ncbi:hypothetical protein A2755_00665 [Candidatus Wolfebacteria bacterium RIFCSPHIGHO2_01_FULL_48_22]|uniref:Septum formation initiator n=2 Tax=Candidatus Wolfeibacteriota TaxID=1752735 RepID=A0A1F8DTS5_9BACT|nr:MAG: hypothetical protein A2755_00665 [Candidatus Wolfebacteria bacterium RIFCSPHIGHO2_01_FULL_48_22]OGM94052.1 MAG: hypothetical protein A2935_02735 [Candidatus Wolfebacteria bacterium RIFCSPLOWO2_01_FULL_47_17b]
MRVKRILILVAFACVLVFLWIQLYGMLRETSELRTSAEERGKAYGALAEENKQLELEARYYVYPENVEKFLRSRFNYKKPGEGMIIVIPD